MKSKSVCHFGAYQRFQGSWGRILAVSHHQDVSRRFKTFQDVWRKICYNEFLQIAIFSSIDSHHHAIHKVGLIFTVEYFDVSSKSFQDISRRLKKNMF